MLGDGEREWIREVLGKGWQGEVFNIGREKVD